MKKAALTLLLALLGLMTAVLVMRKNRRKF